MRRQKLSEGVPRALLDLIRSGSVGLGEALPSERELMERLGVGRPAIREAMQSLETIGLIEIRHGGRARVIEPSVGRMVEQVGETMAHLLANSPASLENLKEARATIEREMARIAARGRSEADFPGDLVSVPGLENLTLAEHREILDAIRRGDAEAAGVAIGRHLIRANELYRRSNVSRK